MDTKRLLELAGVTGKQLDEVSRRGFLKGAGAAAAAAGLSVSRADGEDSTRVTINIPHDFVQELIDNGDAEGHDFNEALDVIVKRLEDILDTGEIMDDMFNY